MNSVTSTFVVFSQLSTFKWVEFVVGFRPCSEGFYLSKKKQHFSNSNSIQKQWTNSHSVEVLLIIPTFFNFPLILSREG